MNPKASFLLHCITLKKHFSRTHPVFIKTLLSYTFLHTTLNLYWKRGDWYRNIAIKFQILSQVGIPRQIVEEMKSGCDYWIINSCVFYDEKNLYFVDQILPGLSSFQQFYCRNEIGSIVLTFHKRKVRPGKMRWPRRGHNWLMIRTRSTPMQGRSEPWIPSITPQGEAPPATAN